MGSSVPVTFLAVPISSIINRIKPMVGTIKQTNPAQAKASATKSAASVKDIAQLAVTYVKQETKVPLQGIGRLLAFGILGAVFMGTGAVLLVLALLRGLQTALSYERTKQAGERLVRSRGMFSGGLSWVPYLITFTAALIAIGVVAAMFVREGQKDKGK
jgi:hypothetical protein